MFKIKKKRPIDYILYSVVIIAGVVIDQLSKWLCVEFLKPKGSVPIIKDVIHLTYVENRGMAFGLMADARWVFMVTSVIMIVAMGLYLYLGMCENKLYWISVAMVVSGGIGNMIDRVALGYVVDFIDFTLIDFAVFNGADSFVCIGAGMLVLALVLDIVKEAKEKKSE
ncbi:MAG: signal peptidase II [Clostridia bacterium]|nr:signal peptidase II [Clostridia bacterium]